MGEKLKPLVAYSVQADECGCIRFARSGAEARRTGAGELDVDWEGVVSCCRAPQFDQFSPGPVPELALWKAGWNFYCCRCDATVCDDGIGKLVNDRAYCGDHAPSALAAHPSHQAASAASKEAGDA